MSGVELLNQGVLGGAIVTQASVRRGKFPADGADFQEFARRQHFMDDVNRLLERARQRPDLRAGVGGAGYTVHTGTSAIALTGTTAKTVIYLKAGSATAPTVCEFAFGYDGVTASNVSALIEMVLGDASTNSTPGTGSTTFTPVQIRGWPSGQAAVTTAANNCSSEPTTLTVAKPWLLTPNAGLMIVQFPLGRELDGLVTASTSGKIVGFRHTAPNSVNVRGYAEFDE